MSAYAPRIITIKIPVDKIRDVIGPGGKMIRSIIEKTGVKIDVEDDGQVNVASADEAAANKAIGMIQELTATAELNKTYLGKVQRITDFGAFVEIMPGTDGLLHVSEIAHYRVKDVRDELKEGQQVLVKVINIDPTGKIRLSRKALITPEEGGAPPAGNGGEGEGATAGASARRPRRSPAPRRSRSWPAPRPRPAPRVEHDTNTTGHDLAHARSIFFVFFVSFVLTRRHRARASPESSRVHHRREGSRLHTQQARCLAG